MQQYDISDDSDCADSTSDWEICEMTTQIKMPYLPMEVMVQILEYLADSDEPIDVTASNYVRRVFVARRLRPYDMFVKPFFMNGTPEIFRNLAGVLQSCHHLRQQTMWYLFNNREFRSEDDATSLVLPRALGKCYASHIQRLELRMYPADLAWQETTWPWLLKVLTEDLPNLNRLKLFTPNEVDRIYPGTYDKRSMAFFKSKGFEYHQYATTETYSEELCSLLRLAAFIVLRHPILGKMFLPTCSRYLLKENERLEARPTTIWAPQELSGYPPGVFAIDIIADDLHLPQSALMKFDVDQVKEEFIIDNLMLNATAIRRLDFASFKTTPLEDLSLPYNSPSSEVDDSHIFDDDVELYGYLRSFQWRILGRQRQTLEELISQVKRKRLLKLQSDYSDSLEQ